MADDTRRNMLKLSAGAASLGALSYLAGKLTARRDGSRGGIVNPRSDDSPDERADPTPTRENRRPAISGSHYVPPEDEVAGIQQAIEDHGPNISIELGSGEYVGSELRVGHGVHLRGRGRNATVLKLADGADTDLVTTPTPDERVSMQVLFENISFEGNKERNSSGDLVYGAFWHGRFIDCDFLNSPNNGVWLAGSSEGSTDDNYVRGCRFARATNDALRLGTNREAWPALGVGRIDSCWFGNNGGRGVYVRGNGNMVTKGKFYANRGVDVEIDRGHRNLVADNDLAKEDSSAPCVSVIASQDNAATGNSIDRNVIWGGFRDGIYCRPNAAEIDALQVHDNVISGSGSSPGNRSGIYAEEGDYSACSARDNTFTGSFQGTAMNLPESWETSGNGT